MGLGDEEGNGCGRMTTSVCRVGRILGFKGVFFSQFELKIGPLSGPDVTHQEIVTLSASQRSMLRLLVAWGEDVGALTSRGLHVGQTERAQVLHTLFHLQLVTLSRCTRKHTDNDAV